MKATTEQSIPHDRPSSAQLSQIAFQIQNPTNKSIRHPCPASSSSQPAHVRPGHPNLTYGQVQPPHPNFRQHWEAKSPVPPEHGKLSETSLKALGDTQRLSRFSFPPSCFSQETNQQVPGFGSDQYPGSAGFVAPELNPDSILANHDSVNRALPPQHANQSGPFSDIPFPHRQSIPGIEPQKLQNQFTSDPTPGPSQGDYQHDNFNFSDSLISSQLDYQPEQKKARKRRITEKRREQNRAHQKAFRLRRDLFVKHKDSEINALEERLDHYKVANKEQHEVITKLQAQLRSAEQMGSASTSTDSVPINSDQYSPGDVLQCDESFVSMNINGLPTFFPSGKFNPSQKDSFQLEKNQSSPAVAEESPAFEWVLKSSEGGVSSMHPKPKDSIFPWASSSSIYVPDQSMWNPNNNNMQEENSNNQNNY